MYVKLYEYVTSMTPYAERPADRVTDEQVATIERLPLYSQILWISGYPVNPELFPVDTRDDPDMVLWQIILNASRQRVARGGWPGPFAQTYGELHGLSRNNHLKLWGQEVTLEELNKPYENILGDAFFTKGKVGHLRVFVIRNDKDMTRFIERCTHTGVHTL